MVRNTEVRFSVFVQLCGRIWGSATEKYVQKKKTQKPCGAHKFWLPWMHMQGVLLLQDSVWAQNKCEDLTIRNVPCVMENIRNCRCCS